MNIPIFGENEPYRGREKRLQMSVREYIDLFHSDLNWFHCPNGGSRNRLEAANLKKEGVKAGVSDVLILKPNKKYHGLAIELKVKGGMVRNSQEVFMNNMINDGYYACVCFNLDSVIKVINNYKENKL